MPVLDPAAFAAALPRSGALLALDPGVKRIGVAASDPARVVGAPVGIFALYDARAGAGLILGLPLNMDGTSGPAVQSARAFARNLLAVRDAPLLFWDERLTTAAATRALIEADVSRARRARVIDQNAAAYLLQSALDALKSQAAL
jgi:putative Holliday junction resolvase